MSNKDFDFTNVIGDALSESDAEGEKYVKLVCLRVFLTSLYIQAVKATVQARKKGTMISLENYGGDGFKLSAGNHRTIQLYYTFDWQSVTIAYSGFPPSIVSFDMSIQTVEPPLKLDEINEFSQSTMALCIKNLFRGK